MEITEPHGKKNNNIQTISAIQQEKKGTIGECRKRHYPY